MSSMAYEKCGRTVCLASVDAQKPAVHSDTFKRYCLGCATKINIACADLKPRGLVFLPDGSAPGIE